MSLLNTIEEEKAIKRNFNTKYKIKSSSGQIFSQ